jgi:hypothetical protein
LYSPFSKEEVAAIMVKYSQEFAIAWCQENGWTDFFTAQYRYWAFPPGAVMPLPLPAPALQILSTPKVLTAKEKLAYGIASVAGLVAISGTYWMNSPMPLVLGFTICAIAFAAIDDEN